MYVRGRASGKKHQSILNLFAMQADLLAFFSLSFSFILFRAGEYEIYAVENIAAIY